MQLNVVFSSASIGVRFSVLFLVTTPQEARNAVTTCTWFCSQPGLV